MAESADANDAVAPGKSRLLLLLLVPLVTALAGGGVAYVLFEKFVAAPPLASAEPTEMPSAPTVYGKFMQLPGIVINPSGSGGRRYLMVDIGLEAPNDKVFAEVGEKEVVVRDAIVRVLSGYTVESLSAPGSHQHLKDTLLVTLNGILTRDVDRIYFTQFVLQ
ncbi:MAG: flagellar basal body-associated protein FliL [Rubricoccaceae bacterium]